MTTLTFGQAAFGLREVKLTSYDGSGAVSMPAAMLLHVTPRIAAAEFAAEGVLIGASGVLAGANWELEAGAISLAVLAKLTGESTVAAGTTPNQTLTLTADAGVEFPYVRIYGRAKGEGTGGIYCKMYRCKLTAIEGTFRQGEFFVTSAAGVAVSNSSGVFEFVQRETDAAL